MIPTAESILKQMKEGKIEALARAITLAESRRPDHHEVLKEILKGLPKPKKVCRRIGISGTPGVGKSTFIESLGLQLVKKGLKVAVLAIDPTSQVTGGSILGDKTRMASLSAHPNAFIRPTPGGDSLGGVGSRTRESILLCEGMGMDVVLVETIGVGQNETAVAAMTDFFAVLMQPGGGDDLQGIKRGILELADMLIVNKADGDKLALAKVAQQDYQQALSILRTSQDEWKVPVELCSSLEGPGPEKIWNKMDQYFNLMNKDNRLEKKREMQLDGWLVDLFFDRIQDRLKRDSTFKSKIQSMREEIKLHQANTFDCVDELLAFYFKES